MSESRKEPAKPKAIAIKSEAARGNRSNQELEVSSGYRSRGSHSSPSSFVVSSADDRSLSPSPKRDSLLNIFNNRDTTELKNLRDEARIMNFKSENLSNEELETKYKLFCLPEQSSSSVERLSVENMIDLKQNSLNEMIEKKISALRLVTKIDRDIAKMKEQIKSCDKNFSSLKKLLNEFF